MLATAKIGFARTLVAAMLALATAGLLGSGLSTATYGISENAAGVYEYTLPWAKSTWLVESCEDDAPRCVTVRAFPTADTSKKPTFTANAYWGVGSWTMTVDEQAITCKDGSHQNTLVTYSWDASTNEGYRSAEDTAACDKKGIFAIPFKLIKKGPPPPSTAAPVPPAPVVGAPPAPLPVVEAQPVPVPAAEAPPIPPAPAPAA